MTDDETSNPSQAGASSAGIPGGYELRAEAEWSGEHRLALAVLEDAIALYLRSRSEGVVKRNEAREAWGWLKSRDRSSPFAFEAICDLLGLDSSAIRRGLRIEPARPAEASVRLATRHRDPQHGTRPPPEQ